MLTEIATTSFSIVVNGQVLIRNIPSRQIAEATVFGLPTEQRAVAEIVTITQDGKALLLG